MARPNAKRELAALKETLEQLGLAIQAMIRRCPFDCTEQGYCGGCQIGFEALKFGRLSNVELASATVAELRANLAGSLEERAALAHEVAEERVEVEHFKVRAVKAERLSRQHFEKLVKLAAEVGRCWCTQEAGDSPCPTHGMDEDES